MGNVMHQRKKGDDQQGIKRMFFAKDAKIAGDRSLMNVGKRTYVNCCAAVGSVQVGRIYPMMSTGVTPKSLSLLKR